MRYRSRPACLRVLAPAVSNAHAHADAVCIAMRTLVNLSDRTSVAWTRACQGTRRGIGRLAPDLVVYRGPDPARPRGQFIAARKFLDTLPQPQIVVPGNHDIPLYNVARRFLAR